ncbi:hypothetical protein [Mucilaginibacter sp.]|uniref:hypothetical protein n=1 Tax=Mucilaginibacter sp. TaxID=1882438 RepID=UPI0025F96858|nr:hypothetical protein [Mucilaginibacter sp.]
MRKLLYNVYSNINDDEFFEIEDKLVKLESAIARILQPKHWRLTNTVRNNDALIIDLTCRDGEFYGNIGVEFEDKPQKKTFRFYVTKSFDEKNKRYFIRTDIFSNKEFSCFENNINDFVFAALKQFDDWSRYNIIYYGTVISLG